MSLALAVAVLAATSTPGPEARVRVLIEAAMAQTKRPVVYDGSYRIIPYPNGDVPPTIGVCTDVVIRAYRAIGIDLQKSVHEDMRAAFAAYPKTWGLARPDANIDHRRVPNLETFFTRQGSALGVSRDGADYAAGDLVTWRLPGGLPHIGIATDRRSPNGARPLIVHNIGRGPELEDMLFAFEVAGHYRYLGE